MTYKLITLSAKGQEIYGALYLGHDRVTDIGWWRTTCENTALLNAIDSIPEQNVSGTTMIKRR